MHAIDSKPLGPVPQSEVDATVATLKAHKHVFEATTPQGDDKIAMDILLPGRRDFCCLFRVKVPVSISLLPHYPLSLPQILVWRRNLGDEQYSGHSSSACR